MKHRRVAAHLLFLLCWVMPARGADVPATAQNSAGTALANPLAARPLDRLSATTDRPLFSPSRRRSPPPALRQDPQPSAIVLPPPDLVLSGVVMDGEGARVVVLVGPEKKVLRAQIGDEIDGWKISQIEGRKLVLSLDGRFATFTLFNRDVDHRGVGESAPGSGNASQPAPQPGLSPANRNARN
jgi:general secretion pathway protein N